MALSVHALTTLATAKGARWLNISGAGSDADIEQAVDQISMAIEVYLGRHLEEATYTDEVHVGHGRQLIQVKQRPIISITTIKENDVAIASTDYSIWSKDAGQIYKAGGWGGGRYVTAGIETDEHPFAVKGNWKVTYVAGWKVPNAPGGSGDPLPKDLELACLLWLKEDYRPREAGVKSETIGSFSRTYELGSAGMPAKVEALLAPYREVLVA